MAKSIGIDLGTTNSVVAIKKVHTEVLKNAEGDWITPSCVTVRKRKLPFSKPEFIVGKHALEWMKQDPANTIVAIKRLMGRSYHDEYVQQIIAERRLHYRIQRHSRGTENSLGVLLAGKEYTPEEISAKILQKVHADAEMIEGGEVEYAVITVPAYFNDKQKHATRTAAALAGLKVRRLLPEPTAAAISFGVDSVKGDEAMTVLVFDFGGGTFDLSVLTISGGQFLEQGKGGDMWLGGEEIDHLISEYVLAQTAADNEIADIKALIQKQDEKQKNRFLGELRMKVEQAKVRLSDEEVAYIEILGVLKDADGDKIDVDVKLTRNKFDELIAPIVETTVRLTRKLLDDMHFSSELIDRVLMVGGSSRIPKVVEAMKRAFGEEKVLVHERPMLAIAEGAAILSHRLADTYECPQCGRQVSQADTLCEGCGFDLERHTIEEGILDIVHSAAHDYFIHLENNEKFLFIEKNTPLPCEKTEVFKLVHPEQKLVHMKFFNIVNDEEESIGDLWLGISMEDDETKDEAAEPLRVEITLKIDENNLIEVSAAIKERPKVHLSRTLSRGKADEKLFMSLERLIDEANEKQYTEYVVEDLLHRSLSAIKDINEVVDSATGELDEPIYERAATKIDKARRMAEEGHISISSIYYGRSVIDDFSPALSSKEKNAIQKKIKHLEEMDEYGSYEENLQAIDDLQRTLRGLGLINHLMELRKAGDFCMDTDPGKAPKFFRAIEDILSAISKGDNEQAAEILKKITPEVHQIVQEHESKTGVIYKDISK